VPFRTTVPSNVHSPNANVHDPKIPNNLAKAREPIRQRKHCKTVTPKTMKLGNTTIKNPPKLKTTHLARAVILAATNILFTVTAVHSFPLGLTSLGDLAETRDCTSLSQRKAAIGKKKMPTRATFQHIVSAQSAPGTRAPFGGLHHSKVCTRAQFQGLHCLRRFALADIRQPHIIKTNHPNSNQLTLQVLLNFTLQAGVTHWLSRRFGTRRTTAHT